MDNQYQIIVCNVFICAHRLPLRNRSMRRLVRKRCRPLSRSCVRYVKFYILTARLFKRLHSCIGCACMLQNLCSVKRLLRYNSQVPWKWSSPEHSILLKTNYISMMIYFVVCFKNISSIYIWPSNSSTLYSNFFFLTHIWSSNCRLFL